MDFSGQIQSWPTPEIWIGHKKPNPEIFEHALASIVLASIISGTPLDENVSDSALAALALASVVIRPLTPINENVADLNGTGAIVLFSLLQASPVSQAQADSALASLALVSVIECTQVNRSVSDSGKASMALILA